MSYIHDFGIYEYSFEVNESNGLIFKFIVIGNKVKGYICMFVRLWGISKYQNGYL